MSDEALCLSTMMNTDPGPVVHATVASDDKQTRENRMVAFWSSLPSCDASILFWITARMQVKGFRWAPMSLMGFCTGSTSLCQKSGILEPGRGLKVSLPAVRLKCTELHRQKTMKIIYRDEPFLVDWLTHRSEQESSSSSWSRKSGALVSCLLEFVILLDSEPHKDTGNQGEALERRLHARDAFSRQGHLCAIVENDATGSHGTSFTILRSISLVKFHRLRKTDAHPSPIIHSTHPRGCDEALEENWAHDPLKDILALDVSEGSWCVD